MSAPTNNPSSKPANDSAASSASASPSARVEPFERMDETRWEGIANNFKTIGGAVLLALFIRTCLFEAFEIEGPSMEPTLLNGDRVVVSKFAFGLFLPFRDQAEVSWAMPEVGNVVIIKSPADGVDIVKRVIALEGDTIEMRADRVYRNGVPLPVQDVGPCVTGIGSLQPRCRVYESKVGDHVFRTSRARSSFDPTPVTVPKGCVYVLGDHRDSSNDSRNPMVGAIPVGRIKGRALSIYWSSAPEGYRWSRMMHAVQ
jgi:signal peptidase I